MLAYRPGTVMGTINGVSRPAPPMPRPGSAPPKVHEPLEAKIPRSINYLADYSGCGYWRLTWPSHLLTAYQKVIVHDSHCMLRDEAF